MKRHYAISMLLVICSTFVSAQNINIPCSLSFEDDNEWNEWKVNVGTPDAKDQWVRGTSTSSDGQYSLYISNNGITPSYSNTQNIVYAYRTLKFPETKGMGRYDISFDWKCASDSVKPELYVYFGLEDALLPASSANPWGLDIASYASSSSSSLPKALTTSCQKLLSDGKTVDFLSATKNGSSKGWRTATLSEDVKISSANSKRKYILLFIWVNDLVNDTLAHQGGVCIDNIQISSANVKRPENLSAYMNCEDSTLHVAWDSPLKFFEIQYKEVNDSHWRSRTHWPRSDDGQQSFFTKLREEGFYDVRVRGATATSEPDTSAWTVINDIEFWCPENHCVDYIHLDRPGVTCRYGRLNNANKLDTIGYWPALDLDDSSGRHTVIKEQHIDPRTIYSYDYEGKMLTDFYGNPTGLQAIPENEKVSVRLGNWEIMYGNESITFEYEVDSVANAILVLNYAIVLEHPEANGRSGFSIRILDENGRVIDPNCGTVEFSYSNEMTNELEQHWYRGYLDPSTGENSYNPEKNGNEENYSCIWKDWSSVGLNLAPYHGRTVQVEVHSWDCYGGGHYGYAYFTLDCVNAKLENTANECELDATTIDVKAPEGFSYTWTDSHGRVVGTERSFSAPPSRETYTCKACMLDGITGEPTECCMYLSTEMSPRYAVPEYNYTYYAKDCKSNVIFRNTSHVIQKSGGREVKTGETCDASWEFRHANETQFTEYSDIEPWIECDPNGDTLYVRQRAMLGNSTCDSIMESVVYVPSINTAPFVIDSVVCEQKDTFFYFYPQTILVKGAGTYTDVKKNIYGCDSTTVLNLSVSKRSEPTFETVNACSLDLPFVYNGFSYVASGEYVQQLTNAAGCDSVVNLTLNVVDKLRVAVDSLPSLCADGSNLIFTFNIMEGAFDSLTVTFDALAQAAGFTNMTVYDNTQTSLTYPYAPTVTPNIYKATLHFHQPQSCGDQLYEMPFIINYASSTIVQRWNDVLGIKNAEYNGGYEFSSYQWYKNGQPIEGQTMPYLYQPGGLDVNADYCAKVTRVSDGVELFICPLRPQPVTDNDIPTLLLTGQQFVMHKAGSARWTNSFGMVAKEDKFEAEGTITAPAREGYYVLTITSGDQPKSYKVLVVR